MTWSAQHVAAYRGLLERAVPIDADLQARCLRCAWQSEGDDRRHAEEQAVNHFMTYHGDVAAIAAELRWARISYAAAAIAALVILVAVLELLGWL